MKKLIAIFVLFLSLQQAIAQTDESIVKAKADKYSKPSRDYFMLQLGHNTWLHKPDSVSLKERGTAINVYLCYDFPIKKTNFSFAAGAGIGSSSIYLNKYHTTLGDTNGYITFKKDQGDSLKRFKMSNTFIDFPFEIRWFENKLNRNKGFKTALGIKAGTLIDCHIKEVFKSTSSNVAVIEKQDARRYFAKSRIMATARIGWGNFSLFANYQLSQQFITGNVQDVAPFNIGFCLSGL